MVKKTKVPRKLLADKLEEAYERGKNHGWNNSIDRAITAETALKKAEDTVHSLTDDVQQLRKAMKPIPILMNAATALLEGPKLSYIESLEISADGLDLNQTNGSCISLKLKMHGQRS